MYRRLEITHPELRYFYQGAWHKEPAAKLGILGAANTRSPQLLFAHPGLIHPTSTLKDI